MKNSSEAFFSVSAKPVVEEVEDPSFAPRIAQAMAGDFVCCWILVWECLHDAFSFNDWSLLLRAATQTISQSGSFYLDTPLSDSSLGIDNAKILLGVLYYKGRGGLAQNMAKAKVLFTEVHSKTPQVWWLLAQCALRGDGELDQQPNYILAKIYFEKLEKSIYAFKSFNTVLACVQQVSITNFFNHVIRQCIGLSQISFGDCLAASSPKCQPGYISKHPPPPVALFYRRLFDLAEPVSQLARLFSPPKYTAELTCCELWNIHHRLEQGVCYHDALLHENNKLSDFASEYPDRCLTLLLEDELLSIESQYHHINALWPPSQIAECKTGLSNTSLRLIEQFRVVFGRYCSANNYKKVAGISENEMLHIKFEFRHFIKPICAGGKGGGAAMAELCSELLRYDSQIKFMSALSQIISEEDISEAFTMKEKADLIKTLILCCRPKPKAEVIASLSDDLLPLDDNVFAGLVAGSTLPDEMPVRRARTENGQRIIKLPNLVTQQALRERWDSYLQYCRFCAEVVESGDSSILTFADFYQKHAIKVALEKAYYRYVINKTDSWPLGLFSSQFSNQHKTFQLTAVRAMLTRCESVKAANTVESCIAAILEFLSNKKVSIEPSSLAYSVMMSFGAIIEIPIDEWVKNKERPEKIRACFCADLSTYYFGSTITSETGYTLY